MPSGKPIKKLPLKTFLALPAGPSPARIFITLNYQPEFDFLQYYKGFHLWFDEEDPIWIDFEIPVMPPTFKIDFGNSKDTKNVVQTGEVVLPKYGKSWQFRWDSFFPYNPEANYVKQTPRGMSVASVKSAIKEFATMATDFMKEDPTPALYMNIFNILSTNNIPFDVAISFYDGGHIGATAVTVETFSAEPDNTGDYKYSISLVQWKDIAPKIVDTNGDSSDGSSNEGPVSMLAIAMMVGGLIGFLLICKMVYSFVSKALMMAAAMYNQMQSMVFAAQLRVLQFKSTWKDLAYRFKTFDNMFNLPKITSKDTSYISSSLKSLSFSKASNQMASFLLENKKYSSGKI